MKNFSCNYNSQVQSMQYIKLYNVIYGNLTLINCSMQEKIPFMLKYFRFYDSEMFQFHKCTQKFKAVFIGYLKKRHHHRHYYFTTQYLKNLNKAPVVVFLYFLQSNIF